MKNVEILPPKSIFRVPIHGHPPLRGWALKYLSGIEEVADVKPGYWMTQWYFAGGSATFAFEAGVTMCFTDETEANRISESLRNEADIETEVVKIG